MDFRFMLGFGTALLVGTEKGQEFFKNAANITGLIAENLAKVGIDAAKETMPSVMKVVETITKETEDNSNEQ